MKSPTRTQPRGWVGAGDAPCGPYAYAVPLQADLQAALGDRYAIEREIGRGGMSLVYLARDLRNKRFVALKVLRPELAATLGHERFLQEISVAAGVDPPDQPPLFDYALTKRTVF